MTAFGIAPEVFLPPRSDHRRAGRALRRRGVKVAAVYGISAEPMSAEEWKRQYVKPG
jgi:hypothetical protein